MTEKFSNTPPEYEPFPVVRLCGNTLNNVGLMFKIGEQAPLLIGRGETHPKIWLYGRTLDNNSWQPFVENNISSRTRPSRIQMPVTPPQQATMVIQDVQRPITVVVMKETILTAERISDDEVVVDVLDLRPLGLNIFGSTPSGLSFAGNTFRSNTFSGAGVAFAAGE